MSLRQPHATAGGTGTTGAARTPASTGIAGTNSGAGGSGSLPQAIRMMLTANRQLATAERKVVHFLAENARDVVRMSVTEVAERSGTSEATVVRLCKKTGFSGFQDFKIQLAQDFSSPVQAIHEEVSVDDTLDTIVKKVFQANIVALEDTLARLRTEDVAKAVQLLSEAEQVLLCGVGNSGLIALDAEQRWLRLGLRVHTEVSGHNQAVRAALLGPKDVLVAISHSGASRDVIDAVKIAQANGSRIIAITHSGKSPLASLADVALYTAARETAFRTEAMSSRIAMLTILDALFVAMAIPRHEQVVETIMRIRRATAAKRV